MRKLALVLILVTGVAAAHAAPLTIDAGNEDYFVTTNETVDEVRVGNINDYNQLIVQSGATLTANNRLYLGYGATSANNLVQVTEAGSTINTTSAWTFVGLYGAENTLLIENGGTVNSYGGHVGYYPDSISNDAQVEGSGSRWNLLSEHLYVARGGDSNSVTISAGGTVAIEGDGKGLRIGVQAVADNNRVTVTGSGSLLSVNDAILIGQSGTNSSLTVAAGGSVSNGGAGFLGYLAGSSGTATVTGEDSQWNNADSLYIGGHSSAAGGSGILNLNDSGLVTVSGTTRLWSTGTIDLDGGNLTTGSFDNSDGGTLNFDDGTLTVNGAGGSFNPGTTDFTIDGSTATDFPELVIAGAASTALTGDLGVGYDNQGAFTIQSGGEVTNTHGYLGSNSSSTGFATVSGSGSKWTNSGGLFVGYSGNGTLNVSAGGEVSNSWGGIGFETGSTGVATVSGSGSKWTNSGVLFLGYSGNGTLNIEDGGEVFNTSSFVGDETPETGHASWGIATVTGSGSKWTNSGGLFVGYLGNSTLNIEDGGEVSSYYGYIGDESGSMGVATVSGSGSKWTNSGGLVVGRVGHGILRVQAGGAVSNTHGSIGVESETTDFAFGSAKVTGSGSQWNNSGSLDVGVHGLASLNIASAGVVSNTVGYIGRHSGSTGGVEVTGAGSQWNNSSNLSVGYEGAAWLNITEGGTVSNVNGHVAAETGSTGAATISGSDSTWTNTENLFVGLNGTGDLNIESAGEVTNTHGYLGYYNDSTGVATVTGADSQWTNSSDLYVGTHGHGTLNIDSAGEVTNMHGYLGYYNDSTGVATVTGEDSQWTNSSDLYVGTHGHGTLNIDSAGEVTNMHGYLGYYNDSTGTATVTGADSLWTNSSDLYVGTHGHGTLNIEDEGQVTVGGTTSIGATGTVNLTGGRFEFGQTTLAEFSRINTAAGAMAGDVMITGVNDVALLPTLQNPAVDLNEVVMVNEGLLHGSAILKSSLDNQASGELRTLASDWVRFEGLNNANAGTIKNFGGQVDFSRNFTNQTGGDINNFGGQIDFAQNVTNENGGFMGGRDVFFRFGGGLTNNGEIGLSVGVHDILGAIVNTATGRVMVAGQSTATFYGDMTNDGDIFTGQGSQSVFLGDVTGSGNFPGTGTVEFAGAVSPGSSPGAVHFGGDVLLGSSAEVESELLGTTAGSEHDQLAIAGTVNLDGTLDLLPLAPYTDPDARGTADEFLLITAGARSGTFNTIQYDGSPLTADSATDGNGSFRSHAGGGLFRSVTYTAATVQLQNLLALAGDTDGDRDVDLGDYNRLATNFAPGANGFAWTDGDFDSDGDIDLGDYNSLASNFAPGGYGPAAVPEPAAALLALLALLLTSLSGNRSTHHTTAKVTIRANGR